jgi:hypothetical protein
MLGILLSTSPVSPTRQWIIDNRAVEARLHPNDIERFMAQIETASDSLEDIAVAWVGPASWGYATCFLPESLAIQIEVFDEISAARDWLKSIL